MTTDAVRDFCRLWPHATGIQAQILSGDLVVDVGEFLQDWGPSRPDGVAEWVGGRPARLTALRETGRAIGCDPEVEYLETRDFKDT